jgi:hypothetical protein
VSLLFTPICTYSFYFMYRIGKWVSVIAGPCIPGQWRQVALVQAENSLSAFLDGKLSASISMDGYQKDSYLPQYSIGKLSTGIGAERFTFMGDISQVRVWSSARTADDLNCNGTCIVFEGERDGTLNLSAMIRLIQTLFVMIILCVCVLFHRYVTVPR